MGPIDKKNIVGSPKFILFAKEHDSLFDIKWNRFFKTIN